MLRARSWHGIKGRGKAEMQLSYISRVFCLALCGAGGLQLASEFVAWLSAPLLLRTAKAGSARRAEQAIFRLTLIARVAPWMLALGLLLPAYMRDEDNFATERVGFLCLALAGGLFSWWAFALLRLSLAAYRTHRCCLRYPAIGRGPGGLPMLLYSGERSVIAVTGLFSACILVSRPLLEGNRFSAPALRAAFAHEGAHVRNHDNLKALLLALAPHVPLSGKHLPSLAGCWRLAAEMAADEEGTDGSSECSLLLAEMLVTLAREGKQCLPRGSIALSSNARNLQIRVERLLGGPASPSFKAKVGMLEPGKLRLAVALAAFVSLMTALGYGCAVLGHQAAELLFCAG